MIALYRFGYVVAAVLVVAAVGLWFIPISKSKQLSEPLRQAFPLIPGQQTTASFVPRLAQVHYIGVALDRNLPFSRLKEIVGGVTPVEATSRPAVDFQLESDGRDVSTQPSKVVWWGRTVGFDLASFNPVPGKRYILHASVLQAEPDLRNLNARLVVDVEPLTGEGIYYGVLLGRLAAIVTITFAVVLACLAFFGVRHRRARLCPQPT
jgi:hypothetical protein